MGRASRRGADMHARRGVTPPAPQAAESHKLGGMAGTKRSSVSKPTVQRARAAALVRAEHGRPAVRLTAPERRLFEEALRLGTELFE